jgi:hypothetical protein
MTVLSSGFVSGFMEAQAHESASNIKALRPDWFITMARSAVFRQYTFSDADAACIADVLGEYADT